jgi:hypothetical protein
VKREITKGRFLAAIVIAIVSDAVSVWAEFVPVVQWVVDGVTAILLCAVLGWHWALLPALVAEAIPGVAAFPSWVLVVLALRMSQRKAAGPPTAPAGERKRVDNTAHP